MQFIKKHKKIFLAAGMLACFAAILFTVSPAAAPTFLDVLAGYTVVPVQRMFAAAGKAVSGTFELFAHTRRIQDENAELNKKIDSLLVENRRLQLADEENERLSDLLELKRRYGELPTTGANVIGKDPSDWFDVYFIDKGSDGGIARNMAVLSGGGLAGTVSLCFPNYSMVVSLVDDRSSVTVECVRTGDIGIVKGDSMLMSQGLCVMEYISGNAQIISGDEVITSVKSAIYPPGLLVGHVIHIKPSAD
ncbi:MAG: rod shape-determining protein MreC, partial [Defluviitaleaceae bacterium]|nr:rod shape-determining protein MreC [Defluviitaleaceae bacterium]